MSVNDQTLDLLAHHAFPRISAALQTRMQSVIKTWEAAVCQTLPSGDELTLKQLRNSVPTILQEIVAALASDTPAATKELVQGSKVHGEARFHDNYNMRELVVEYRLLRRVIIEQVSAELGERLDQRQNVALNMAVDTAVQSGIVAFSDHQRERIRAASESQSKYMSFLSHDLRNHLNHATLVLQLLGQRLASIEGCADGVEDVESIQRSIFLTMDGMDRLLQAERLRKEAVEPKLEPVDLRHVLTEIAGRFSLQAKGKGLSLVVDVPMGAEARTDRELVALVIQNLLGNAIKYSAQGSVRVTAKAASNGIVDGSGWVLEVSDEGPGIAPEKLSGLFDAFSRGDTHGQPGMGLGLSIASQATKVLGAKLEIDSKVGVGSTFRLLLRSHSSNLSPSSAA